MAIEKVREYLKKWNKESEIKEFEESSATVELAAKAIGCEMEKIAKSLTFKIDDRTILIVAAGDTKVNSSKYKNKFLNKAKMLTADEVLDRIGHGVGGVCPFGIKEGVEVYLDESLKRFSTVYPACGSSNSVIELTLQELEEYSKAIEWVDVCKGWNE